MARKRSSGAGGLLLIGLVFVVGALSAVPKEVWATLVVLVAAYAVLKLVKSDKKVTPVERSAAVAVVTQSGTAEALSETNEQQAGGASAEVQRGLRAPRANARVAHADELVRVLAPQPKSAGFQIPQPNSEIRPTRQDPARWVPPGEEVSLAGFQLTGGMLYVGSGLRALNGVTEPALLNPHLHVAGGVVDESIRLMGYWPSYSDISPEARRAYLQWLARGRTNPLADMGYVFLFFYGLERRSLLDAPKDGTAAGEIPAIVAEVRRLMTLYGASGSFRRYATSFLEYLEAETRAQGLLDLENPPETEPGYELPLTLRLGLGQMALRGIPVPAAWAHAWVLSDPNINRRTPVTRCAEAFKICSRRATRRPMARAWCSL